MRIVAHFIAFQPPTETMTRALSARKSICFFFRSNRHWTRTTTQSHPPLAFALRVRTTPTHSLQSYPFIFIRTGQIFDFLFTCDPRKIFKLVRDTSFAAYIAWLASSMPPKPPPPPVPLRAELVPPSPRNEFFNSKLFSTLLEEKNHL